MSRLRLYEAHGVVFTGDAGTEKIGRCPFTDRDDKFYVNKITGLWDSKTLGEGGNQGQFLERVSKIYQKNLTTKKLMALVADRTHKESGIAIPSDVFRRWGVGWTGTHYSIPIRDAGGTMVDIRLYKLGQRVMSTAGAQLGLMGAEHLRGHPNEDVYVCEGEWDAMAMDWALQQAGWPAVVVGVPGAGVFKPDWVPWLSSRVVHTLYDHDEAGEQGEMNTFKRLNSVVSVLTCVHWPDSLPSGWDARDWVLTKLKDSKPKKVIEDLFKLFQRVPRKSILPDTEATGATTAAPPPVSSLAHVNGQRAPSPWTKKKPTWENLIETFRKWLFLDNMQAAEIMLATVLSQRIDGPPIWMFIVGPPGGAKTEHLAALAETKDIYMTSSLTSAALISGASWKDGVDPSLIPRLDGRIVVIKDFTTIMSKPDNEKEEIFGILRDAYDGKCGKVFGNGVERHYQSRFTVVAAVTPRIYDLGSNHASLGERFLKFAIGDNLHHAKEQDIILRAIQNIDRETKMRNELIDVVTAFVEHRRTTADVPSIPDHITRQIVFLGMFGARMRGTVTRDMFRHEIVTSRPSAEIGSRLGIQLAKLAKSLAMVHGRKEVTEHEYLLLKKTMLDTIPQRTEDVLRYLLQATPTTDVTVTSQEMAIHTRYPQATVDRILQDLNVLGIVQQTGPTWKFRWTLSEYIRMCISETKLYQTESELKRKSQIVIKVRRRTGTITRHG